METIRKRKQQESVGLRFSDVMWTMQQILFMGVDKRVAVFLWDEMSRLKKQVISITHDEIAKILGVQEKLSQKYSNILLKMEQFF